MGNLMDYSKDNKFIPVTSIPAHTGEEVARDLSVAIPDYGLYI
ncbi:hypothetical protein [Bacillus tianshenii]|nr:hypothetical protein [Bacillus tianshenii]